MNPTHVTFDPSRNYLTFFEKSLLADVFENRLKRLAPELFSSTAQNAIIYY
jgi:hypothetical protein